MTMGEMDVEQVRVLLEPLWRKNRGQVLRRLDHVRRALAAPGEPDASVRADLHALVGTLGTYGWPDGSDLAEAVLQSLPEQSPAQRRELLHRLDALAVTLRHGLDTPSAASDDPDGGWQGGGGVR